MSLRGGIDLGGTKIQAVILDEDGEVRGQARRPTPHVGGPADVIAALAECLREAARESGLPDAVGVGSPGEIDADSGTVSQAKNLPDWEGAYALGPALSQALEGARVRVGNDVAVAIQAEAALGAGRPYSSLLGVFWGTGVGGGLILDGKPWHGRGAAGEIGHTVVKLGGARCPCGRRGCLEAYAGRAAMEAKARRKPGKTKLFELMEEHGKERLTSGIWERALDADDKLAVHLIDRAVAALGAGIASAVNLLDVQAVVIGGGLGDRLGRPYADRIKHAMMPHLFSDGRPPDVHVSALGDLGGALGAAMLASA
ncbi:MAG: ROK family protein [Solirubrobacteraceae bacterium]